MVWASEITKIYRLVCRNQLSVWCIWEFTRGDHLLEPAVNISKGELTTISNHDFALRGATLPTFSLNLVDHIHPGQHLSKNNMPSI